VVSAAYRLQRGLSEQIDLGWQWPIGNPSGAEGRWYSVGRLNFSLQDRRLVDAVVGFEYDAGCWLGRVVVERLQSSTSSSNKRILFQLEFIGFTRAGLQRPADAEGQYPSLPVPARTGHCAQPLQQLRVEKTMQHRLPARTLASLAGLALGAAALAPLASQAQGLRVSPQIGTSRSGQPAPPAGPRQADYIVAVVNSEPITNNEVRARMVRIEQQMAQQGGALPPRPQLARQVLERLISEKGAAAAGA
jgi:hypothetical protein